MEFMFPIIAGMVGLLALLVGAYLLTKVITFAILKAKQQFKEFNHGEKEEQVQKQSSK